MTRQKYRLSKITKLHEQIAHLNARTRVEIARRLVQNEHLRIVKERPRQLKALLHSLRHRRNKLERKFVEIGELHDGIDDGIVAPLADSVRVCKELKVLARRHAIVHSGVIGHVSYNLSHLLRFERYIVPIDCHAPRHRFKQRRKNANGGGLASTVGADEAKNFTRHHIERHVSKDILIAESVPKMPNTNRGSFAHGAPFFSAVAGVCVPTMRTTVRSFFILKPVSLAPFGVSSSARRMGTSRGHHSIP